MSVVGRLVEDRINTLTAAVVFVFSLVVYTFNTNQAPFSECNRLTVGMY